MPSKDIREAVEKLEGFLTWLVDTWRSKNWLRVLLLVETLCMLFLNPLVLREGAKLLDVPIPKWYTIVWTIWIASIFVIAGLLAAKGPVATLSSDVAEHQVIRGLRPYTRTDAKIFNRLQRHDILRECLTSICDQEFRLGILSGESGSGKSSFLQAGLLPTLSNRDHTCVYVKFSEQPPQESIRQALIDQLQFLTDAHDPLRVLASTAQSEKRPIVLLFDQFEQFFIHQKRKIDREVFINDLARWYTSKPTQSVKILISIRGDFTDRLIELQKAMAYSLGPQETFRLEKFEPAQAAAVFRVIGEIEQIAVDQKFVEEVVTHELASHEDGLVSPVDVQVLAWMIAGQPRSAERGLNRVAYQRLGGVEGLLEMFLKRALDARETQSRRQAALEVLLALTDLQKNARAGTLTAQQIIDRPHGTLKHDILEAIEWLARADVRLITPTERDGIKVYELAHERLIAAIRRIASQELSEIDKTNLMFDRRANEWLGNERSSRYLLTYRELRRIRHYKPYLRFDGPNSAKRLLMAASIKRLIIRSCAILAVLFFPLCLGLWWFSPFGQIWQVKRDLLTLTKRVDDPRSLAAASQALAANYDFQDARRITFALENKPFPNRIFEESIVALVTAYIQAGQKREAIEIVDSLFLVNPETSPLAREKTLALEPKIVELCKLLGKEKDLLKAIDIHAEHSLRYEYGFDRSDSVPVLATLYVQLGQVEKAKTLMEQVYNVSRLKRSDRKQEIIRGMLPYNESNDREFEPDEVLVGLLRDSRLATIYLNAGDIQLASALADDLYRKLKTTFSGEVALRLVSVYSELGNYQRADELLNLFPSDPTKTTTDVVISRINSNLRLGVRFGYLPRLNFALEYFKQLEDLRRAYQSGTIRDVESRADLTDYSLNHLRETIAAAYEEFWANEGGREQLQNQCRNLMDFSPDRADQAWLLAVVAKIAAKRGEYEYSFLLIRESEEIINSLGTATKAELYPIIAEAWAFTGNWRKAREIATLTGNDTAQLFALARIMAAWNRTPSLGVRSPN
jgi:hypothetical protein